MSTKNIVHITDADFDSKVMQSDKPVILYFWAEWCGPCKAVAPILEELADDYQETLVVAKLNVDDNTEIAERYAVRGIPTLLLFKAGEIVNKQVGALPKAQLTAFIDNNI